MARAHSAARLILFACTALVPVDQALADDQSDRIKSLEQRLEGNLQLIEKLAARVAELERAAKSAQAAAPAPLGSIAQSQSLNALQDSVDQISESLSKRASDQGLPIHGFADVGAAQSIGADPQRLRGFNVGTFELYLTPQFGDRVKSLFELAFEIDPSGHAQFELERLQLGYSLNDELTLWAGRFHTPFGLWNTLFHHGANLQTSIYRPRFIDFEDKGGIVPDHSVGLWASGKAALGPGKITYDAYLTNGPRIRERSLDFNAFTDDSPGKMLGVNVGYQPTGALEGLSVGVHGFGSTVNVYDANGSAMSQTKLRMGGAYLGYDANQWEIIAEHYRFANTAERSGVRRTSSAWFAQIGKTLGSITPFVRYEVASLDPDDAYFSSQRSGRSYKRGVLGARYAIDSRSSLKFEFSGTRESSVLLIDESGAPIAFTGTSYRRAAFQYSIAF